MADFSWAQWGIVECVYVRVLLEAVCVCVKKNEATINSSTFLKMC